MNQHAYVSGVLHYYGENYYEPGNPDDGVWHECHYPAPKCLGGKTTLLLLEQHHAIQGILQSEEYNHPCIYGWEEQYLPREYLHLYDKWMSVRHDLSVTAKYRKWGFACELLPVPIYWKGNPSAPKPVLIHYSDGTDMYCESIKQASKKLNVTQSTIQRRIVLPVHVQLCLEDHAN